MGYYSLSIDDDNDDDDERHWKKILKYICVGCCRRIFTNESSKLRV